MAWVREDGVWLRAASVRIEPHGGEGLGALVFGGPWQAYRMRVAGESAPEPDPDEESPARRPKPPQRLTPFSLEFASLTTEEEILRFAERWGPLGVQPFDPELHPDPWLDEGAVRKVPREHVPQDATRLQADSAGWAHPGGWPGWIVAEGEAFAVRMLAWESLYHWRGAIDAVRHLLTEKPGRELEGEKAEQVFELIRRGVHFGPAVRAGRWVLEWNLDALFHAIALDAFFRLTKGETIRQCAAPGCWRLFIPRHPDAKYCSVGCQRSVQNAKLYRARRLAWDTAQELVAQGVRGKELVRQVTTRLNERLREKRDEATIARWLRRAAQKKGANPDARS